MAVPIDIDFHLFEVGEKKVKEMIDFMGRQPARKAIIDAGTEGLLNALRRHFANREKERPKSTGFPWFGKSYPKKYFWRGTRGTSVSEAACVMRATPRRRTGRTAAAFQFTPAYAGDRKI